MTFFRKLMPFVLVEVILVVLFYILEFWEVIGWNAIAAISAAAAACFAAYQIFADRKWRRIDRTFQNSPYRQLKFRENLRLIENRIEKLQKPLNKELLEKEIINNECYRPKFLDCANLFGQMASEYEEGLLDRTLADRVLLIKFMEFIDIFKFWFDQDNKKIVPRKHVYRDTLKLYDRWYSTLSEDQRSRLRAKRQVG